MCAFLIAAGVVFLTAVVSAAINLVGPS